MAYVKVKDRIKEPEVNPEVKEQIEQPAVMATPTIRVKKDWSKKDKLELPKAYFTKYKGMHPVWIRRVDSEMEEKEGEGYEYPTLTKEERKSSGPLAQGSSETSFITRGDLILMHIPEQDYQDKLGSETQPIRDRQKYIAEQSARQAKLRGITADTSETLEDK